MRNLTVGSVLQRYVTILERTSGFPLFSMYISWLYKQLKNIKMPVAVDSVGFCVYSHLQSRIWWYFEDLEAQRQILMDALLGGAFCSPPSPQVMHAWIFVCFNQYVCLISEGLWSVLLQVAIRIMLNHCHLSLYLFAFTYLVCQSCHHILCTSLPCVYIYGWNLPWHDLRFTQGMQLLYLLLIVRFDGQKPCQ